MRAACDLAIGYRRVFGSMNEANEYSKHYAQVDHSNKANLDLHLQISSGARSSDYPVFYHLQRSAAGARTLFDFGGNVGNLFYPYSKYLGLGTQFLWTVHDLPRTIDAGREISRLRDEHRLRFTDHYEALDGSDVFLASGSLHYLDRPLAELLKPLRNMPRHVIINRTPMSEMKTVVTVQDAGYMLCACTVLYKQNLIMEMQAIGYELVDSWSVPERSFQIPFYPECSANAYSGLYFRLVDRTEEPSTSSDRRGDVHAGVGCENGWRAEVAPRD